MEPNWLYEEFGKSDSTIKLLTNCFRIVLKDQTGLRDCGITESVIYPDLDGLGREIRQLWEDRRAAAEQNV